MPVPLVIFGFLVFIFFLPLPFHIVFLVLDILLIVFLLLLRGLLGGLLEATWGFLGKRDAPQAARREPKEILVASRIPTSSSREDARASCLDQGRLSCRSEVSRSAPSKFRRR